MSSEAHGEGSLFATSRQGLEGEAHLWYALPDALVEPSLLARYEALSSTEERAKRARFVSEKDRHLDLVSRALLRTILSRYAPEVPPHDWRFERNRYGRPSIAAAHGVPWLRFNLSHTRGLVAMIVSADGDVGIDVEDVARPGETVELAETYFSPSEIRSLRALRVGQQRERFYELWTLKEAYIKARGVGLSLGLARCSFELDETPLAISFDSSSSDDPARWRFALFRPTKEHALAVAIERPDGRDATIRITRTVPLIEAEVVSLPRSR